MSSKRTYHAWQTGLTAKDVFELAGLTYRQLNDWDKRAGILESDRTSLDEGWRRFTFAEILALAILATIREHFPIPLEESKYLYQWLLGKHPSEADEKLAKIADESLQEFEDNPDAMLILQGRRRELAVPPSDESVDKTLKEYAFAQINSRRTKPVHCALQIAQLGMAVYLVTDKKESLILTETHLGSFVEHRMIQKPTIVLPLNELLEVIMTRADIPFHPLDSVFGSFRTYWEKVDALGSLGTEEEELLRLLRERDYQRVIAHMKGGKIVRIEREEELAPAKQDSIEAQILEAIALGEHHTVTLEKRDGKIVRINRKESFKLDKVTGRT